jgi:hypothetical protein
MVLATSWAVLPSALASVLVSEQALAQVSEPASVPRPV